MAVNDIIASTNRKLIDAVSGIKFMNLIGWFIFAIILIGGLYWLFIIYRNKKIYSSIIKGFEIIGVNFIPTIDDRARKVKLGSGGFEILFLKRLKTWRLAYGSRVGKNTYYYFIMPDGYWYNGLFSSNMFMIDKLGGLIPIVTTNPNMRSQYTSLEKQIDSLHKEKEKFWDKYGSWILSLSFVLVAGVMLWLNYKEFVTVSTNFNTAIDKMGLLIDKLNVLTGNVQNTQGAGGLVPVK
jgi:hypothetical protein